VHSSRKLGVVHRDLLQRLRPMCQSSDERYSHEVQQDFRVMIDTHAGEGLYDEPSRRDFKVYIHGPGGAVGDCRPGTGNLAPIAEGASLHQTRLEAYQRCVLYFQHLLGNDVYPGSPALMLASAFDHAGVLQAVLRG
jgi:23S rRNA A2030 N6-methylase RlmJ